MARADIIPDGRGLGGRLANTFMATTVRDKEYRRASSTETGYYTLPHFRLKMTFSKTPKMCALYSRDKMRMQSTTSAICNMCNLQHVQFATRAICNTRNLQHVQFAIRAICNLCNFQHRQFSTPAICNTCNL